MKQLVVGKHIQHDTQEEGEVVVDRLVGKGLVDTMESTMESTMEQRQQEMARFASGRSTGRLNIEVLQEIQEGIGGRQGRQGWEGWEGRVGMEGRVEVQEKLEVQEVLEDEERLEVQEVGQGMYNEGAPQTEESQDDNQSDLLLDDILGEMPEVKEDGRKTGQVLVREVGGVRDRLGIFHS